MAEKLKYDGTAVWFIDSERQKTFHFSEAVDKFKTVLFHRKDKPVEWKSFEDLKEYRIGLTHGYSYGDRFHAAEKKYGLKIDISPTDTLGFKKLLKGRIDLLACDLGVGYWILNNEFPASQRSLVTNDPNVLVENTVHFIAPKAQKDSLDKVNT